MSDKIPYAYGASVSMGRGANVHATIPTTLSAPFPYFGGKPRWASEIWSRFGRADVYAEPFAGSLAVLLANPAPAPREVVCDKDGLICNFWRSLRADPEATAHWADYPTIHQDLTARHKWLRRWGREHAPQLVEDAEYFDAKAAGWWVWGISLWIGGGWVSAQRATIPDKRPVAKYGGSGIATGCGVSAQRLNTGQIPHMGDRPNCGKGVAKQRDSIPAGRLSDWFAVLAHRLERVVVLNRDWKSAVTPSLLADTPSGPGERINRCILLDPPYRTDRRKADLYGSDADGTSDDVAVASYEWAVEHGDRYRVAYCAHEDDFPVPVGWESLTRGFAGHRAGHAGTSDIVMFSPACTVPQPDLFA